MLTIAVSDTTSIILPTFVAMLNDVANFGQKHFLGELLIVFLIIILLILWAREDKP